MSDLYAQEHADAHRGLENMFEEVLRRALEDATCGRDYTDKVKRLLDTFNGQSRSAERLFLKVRELEGMKPSPQG